MFAGAGIIAARWIGSDRRFGAPHGLVEKVAVREILMGAQDDLTNVLAVMFGVSVGTGRSDLVALAGVSAAAAEAVSMGGVLYSSTRAANNHDRRVQGELVDVVGRLNPSHSGSRHSSRR